MFSEDPTVDYVPGDLVPDKGHEKVDATAIHLDPTFDGIVSSHVLEHIPDDLSAITEMYRVLKPAGWAVVMVPVVDTLAETYESDAVQSRWARHRHFGQHDHVRVYGRDLPNRLEAAGFLVTVRQYADEFPVSDFRRFGLRSSDVIFYCQKPADSQSPG
jgi:predicted SAM-dependent methyltransferase